MKDPQNAAMFLFMQERDPSHLDTEKAVRAHAVDVGLVMACNAGAVIHPAMKPSLLLANKYNSVKPDPVASYYYSVREIREAIQEYNKDTVAKTSRILGAIVSDRKCYCLYYTGASRMYWRNPTELNTAASINALLEARGLPCDLMCQVIIGTNMRVAEKITRPGVNVRSKFITLDDEFNNCYFITNDEDGEALLRLITNRRLQESFIRSFMKDTYKPLDTVNRAVDAVTLDGQRPVIFSYECDLLRLASIDLVPIGFEETPIILCLDYQVDAIQNIVGGMVEVRAIQTPIPT
jgi:hypothetical protein